MCSRLQFKEHVVSIGQKIPVNSAIRLNGTGTWKGFIRSDADEKTKGFWKHNGFNAKLDVPADRFAERSRKTRDNVFEDVPQGNVVYAIGNRQTGHVNVLTRKATKEEAEKFGHDRIPVTGTVRFK